MKKRRDTVYPFRTKKGLLTICTSIETIPGVFPVFYLTLPQHIPIFHDISGIPAVRHVSLFRAGGSGLENIPEKSDWNPAV